jgi:hypothetical protein
VRPGLRATALLPALVRLRGCPLGGRFHLGDVSLEAGHGLALVGNHVTLALC